MNLDELVADAKERLHRSIGQRTRHAKLDIYNRASKMQGRLNVFGRVRPRVVFDLQGAPR